MNREQIMRSRFLAGYVRRYHTWPTLNVQTVGHHSWRVATLLIELFGIPRAEVLFYCLWHDGGEFSAGDPPYPVKKTTPGMREVMDVAEAHGLDLLGIEMPELTPLEKIQVKIADLLEMYEFGNMEVLMGNTFGAPVRDDTLAEAWRLAELHGLVKPLMAWSDTNGID